MESTATARDQAMPNTLMQMVEYHCRSGAASASQSMDYCPKIPNRLAKENKHADEFFFRTPPSSSQSSSSLSFMVSSTDSVKSHLNPEARKDGRVKRSKSSSVLEVVMFPTRGASLKQNASFSEGSTGRRGNLTLSNGTNSLKRAGTSLSASRRFSDLSQSSSATSKLCASGLL